ncbi:hypothetical protein EDD37DRAFT_634328 [Exophiala viscosa]|uniref:uncharacterized protein n=1 Tax=Exophiala viscosa TaxID=2486360 RepID=UPI002195C9FF|nr:hypothetical protein EDD37DRAFT_634328 [Exophiala viscosa]
MSSSYITAHTAWPTSVAVKPEVQRLLALFYSLLDIPDTSVGHRFAEEVFAKDGVMFGMGPGFDGEAEIRKSREYAWIDYTSRRHEMLRVYAHDALGLDLLVIGRVEMGVRNGRTVNEEFVARFVVDEATLESKSPNGDDGVRLKFSRVWSNMEPIMAAMREQ